MESSQKEKQLLEDIWRSQAPVSLPPVDLTSKNFPAAWMAGEGADCSIQGVCQSIMDCLGWPEWVRLYQKPIQALAAARELARSLGKGSGVVYVAPGTGQPLHPPKGEPGMAVLRADWAPDEESLCMDQRDIRAAGLLFLIDETATALRLDQKGAAGFYGLEPDVALLGPALAGGRDFAALAGMGPAPAESRHEPDADAMAAVCGVLARAGHAQFSRDMADLGRMFKLGLEFFTGKAKVSEELDWDGPEAMPRISGRRMWAFIRLAEEEGLIMQPVIRLDPALTAEEFPQRVWARLARAAARLRVLPLGDMAPVGWRDAAESTSCSHAAQILAAMEEN